MKVDLAGKIKNTQLPRSKALLPMFEAVVNSFQAIEDADGALMSPSIDIVVERETVLQNVEVEGEVSGFSIIDKGIGFNEINLDSFFTSDTQYKVGRGGKGLGRFIWLKAFQYAEVESHYRESGAVLKRAFRFTTTGDQPTGPATSSKELGPKTTVRLVGMKSPYKESCPRGLLLIGHQLVEHCLPFFLDPTCPNVTIRDEHQSVDLNAHFRETFASKATQHTFAVGDSVFSLKGLRLQNPHETQHRLLYAANFREVLAEKLEKYLPNLQQKRLTDSDGEKFVYLGFVEGEYLDQHVNGERTSFSFPVNRDRYSDSLLEEITLDAIRQGAIACVSTDLQPFLDEINTEKRSTISNYISEEAPQYRPLMRYMEEFIDRIVSVEGRAASPFFVQIEIYQPPPASSSPPEPLRKKRTGVTLAVLFVVSFVVKGSAGAG
jgi:hypothetical protein